MNNGTNGNGLIVALSFISGLSGGNILMSLLAAIIVGVLTKAVDSVIRLGVAALTNRWRQRAVLAEARANHAEARLKELERQKDAEQLSG